MVVKAHNSSIAALKLSQDGTILLTASDKGTLVRLFNTETGDQISEVRRGADQAVITDLSISRDNKLVCCSSDKGTVHVFSNNGEEKENKKSSLSAISGVIGYFGSTWSLAQFRVKDSTCKIAIVDNKIFSISKEGNYFWGDITQGDIKIKKQINFLEES